MDPNVALSTMRLAHMANRDREGMEAFGALDAWLVAGGFLPDSWTPRNGAIIEPCHDDSEECVHCAYPEHAAVVIRLDSKPVCREHIWRALTGLGVRDRHI